MADPVTIGGALASLKAASDIVGILYKAKLAADVQEQVSHLKQLIFNAREQAFDAQEELSLVKAEVAKLNRQIDAFSQWGEDRQRYQMFQPLDVHSVVYALRESLAGGEPAHYLCANCYQQHRKSILNNGQTKSQWTTFDCPNCKASIPTAYRGQVPSVYAPG